MLGLLRRWLQSRRQRVFRFRDGLWWRSVDPIDASFRLANHPRYLPRHLDEARAGDEEALEIVADAACFAFGVRRMRAGQRDGKTVGELVELMFEFEYWLSALKKNTARSRTSRQSTAATSTA